MFDRIAHRYDLLNRLLSLGRDVAWRKKLVRHLPEGRDLEVIDLATGTADVLLALETSGRVRRGIGVDLSWGMLTFGRKKVVARGLDDRLLLVRSDATRLGVAGEAFDAVTIAFGIRNVTDVAAGLREIHRLLKPGGRALILEFSLPQNRPFRWLYLFYFRHVLPRLGGLISGDSQAYHYLNRTVETFPYGADFEALMADAGFRHAKGIPLTLGIATLYIGAK